MTTIRIANCTVTPTELVHDLLGRFKRTGIIRKPEPGEYYLGQIQIGIGIYIGDPGKMGPREILEKVTG